MLSHRQHLSGTPGESGDESAHDTGVDTFNTGLGGPLLSVFPHRGSLKRGGIVERRTTHRWKRYWSKDGLRLVPTLVTALGFLKPFV